MRISMVESAELEGGWRRQGGGGWRSAAAARQQYLMAQRAFFPVGSAEWCKHVFGKGCMAGAAHPRMWLGSIWHPDARLGRVSEWPHVDGWQCFRSKRWVTAPPTNADGRRPGTCDQCASSGLADCDSHHCDRGWSPQSPSAESEVVRQLVRTLALAQVDGALEDQLHGSCEGMWRDYAAGRRWPHAAAARLCALRGARRLQRLALAHPAALLAA